MMFTNDLQSLKVRSDRRELRRRGTPQFPCSVYRTVAGSYPNGEVPWHWHDEVELKLVLEGSARVSCMGDTFLLSAGEGMFVNGGVLHRTREVQECVIGSIVFEMPVLTGSMGSVFEEQYFRPIYQNPALPYALLTADVPWQAQALAQLSLACKAGLEQPYAYELDLRAGLSRFWSEFCRANRQILAAPRQPEDENAERLRVMLAYIEAHFTEELTPADLAEAAHISERECYRCFERMLEASPTACVLRRRVAYAATLLRETDLPITDIGMQAGFRSPSYFGKRFRERMGCTPSEFRQKWIESKEASASVK